MTSVYTILTSMGAERLRSLTSSPADQLVRTKANRYLLSESANVITNRSPEAQPDPSVPENLPKPALYSR